MNKLKYILLLNIIFAVPLFAQSGYSVSAAMGLGFVNAPDLNDYLIYVNGSDENVNSFASGLSLSFEVNKRLGNENDISLQFDYVYSGNEYDIAGYGSRYTFNYTILKTNLAYYKVYPGEGYQFRLGAGAGPRFLSVTESEPGLTSKNELSKVGFGMVATFDASTALSPQSYVYLNGNLQYDIIGAPENENGVLKNKSSNKEVVFNNFTAGVKIGILYML